MLSRSPVPAASCGGGRGILEAWRSVTAGPEAGLSPPPYACNQKTSKDFLELLLALPHDQSGPASVTEPGRHALALPSRSELDVVVSSAGRLAGDRPPLWPVSRARTSPMVAERLIGSGTGRCPWTS